MAGCGISSHITEADWVVRTPLGRARPRVGRIERGELVEKRVEGQWVMYFGAGGYVFEGEWVVVFYNIVCFSVLWGCLGVGWRVGEWVSLRVLGNGCIFAVY